MVEKLAGWRGVLAMSFAVLMAGLLVLAMPRVADAKKSKPPAVSVEGEGVNSFGNRFKFYARDKDGDPQTTDDVEGRAVIRFDGGGIYRAKVECLNVSGGNVYLLAEVKETKHFVVETGDLVEFEMTDSGLPDGEGDKELDGIAQTDECRAPNTLGDEFIVEEGNVKVKQVP